MTHVARLALLAGVVTVLAVSCDGLKQNSEDCQSNDECLSECCYPSKTRQPWCSAGTVCMGSASGGGAGGGASGGGSGGGASSSGGGSGGGTTSGTGACAYFDSSLNRILCNNAAVSASSCSGKFAAGASCANLSCPLGTTNPQNCTFTSGSGGGSGTGGGTGSGGGGGSTLLCGRYRVLDPGSQSSPGSGQVSDAETGFVWTRYNADPRTQADAITYCANRGMRLPTRAEALDIAPACCVSTPTSMNCAVAFPGWQTWTTTSAGSGQAYYVNSHGITCLPSTCIKSVTATAGVMCVND
jgi:hypothetical protein